MASAATIRKIKDFASQIHLCGVDLKRVILYGSYANNTQTRYSDIDVALVADEFSGVPSEDVKLFLKAMRKHYMVQAQTYNTKDFTPNRDPFVEEILKTGIEIKA
jgi:predicted nucleotidyltransferase